MGTRGELTDAGRRGGRALPVFVGGVAAVLAAANVLLVLGAVLGVPPVGVLGVVPVLVLDALVVAVLVALARRGRPDTTATLLPRRYPGLARLVAGMSVLWAVVAVAGDSFWALVAAPVGVFALGMSLFRTTAVWWRWCARAAAMTVLTWPVPVLAGMRLDRDAIEGWGVGFGSLVTTLLVALTVVLAALAAVGFAVAGRGSPATAAPQALPDRS